MRRAACLILLALTMTACGQQRGADRVAEADQRERARQEKAARAMVAQTEDEVRVKMLEQRLAALEAQVAAMQGDRKLLDAQLVEQRLTQIETQRLAGENPPVTPGAVGRTANATGSTGTAKPAPRPSPSATPAARKPLVLDLR